MLHHYLISSGKQLAFAFCLLLSGGLMASAEFTCNIKCPPDIVLDCGVDPNPGLTGRPYYEPVCANPNPGPGDYTYFDTPGTLPGYSSVIYREFSGFDPSYGPTTCTQIIYFRDNGTTPPVFEDCPADITVNSEAEIPPVANPTAGPNADVTYNGETIDDSCGPDEYTITRMWTAVNDCGGETICKQKITVKKKLINDCYSLEYGMEYNEENNTTRFNYVLCLIGDKCKDISNIRFSIPCDMPKENLLEASSSLAGLKVEINNKTGRCDGRYDVQFDGFNDGAMKREPNQCVSFTYLLKGDLREHITDVTIKAGNQTGLDFLGLGMNGAGCTERQSASSTSQDFKGKRGRVDLGTASPEAIAGVMVFPNPVREQLTLQFAAGHDQQVTLQVIDAMGRLKMTRSLEAASGNNQVEVEVSDLPAGLYRVILTPSEGGRTIHPFIRLSH